MENSEFEKDVVNPTRGLRLVPLEKASGGTCNAYTARLFGKKVFVKEIRPELANDARMLAAFRKEAEIGFRLDHPNLPKYIFAEGILSSERYIVQEFIDGRTLPDFINENPTYFKNRKNADRFIREFIDVIDYLHHNQIVHLDLKPENILISRVGTSLKLVDLGFCASDCHDGTRGFTIGELAPEGAVNPKERGAESDYYGIGKILSYIRSHTLGLSGREFRTLERGLLQPDPSKRISSKEEIEKILERKVSLGRVWIGVSVALIISAIVFLVIVMVDVADHDDAKADETAENHELPAVEETETHINTIEPTGIRVSDGTYRETPDPLRGGEEKLPTQNQEPNIPSQSGFTYESYKKLKAEMEANINKYFADFNEMVSSFIKEGRYSENDYKIITTSYREALHKTFDTAPYKAKYKDLSPSLIDDTMAELMQKLEKNNRGTVYNEYMELYQRSAEGSSK